MSDKLVEMKVADFVNKLASSSPAPGGGSAAALSAAMGTGLVHMVTQLTIGKKKFAEHEELMGEIAASAMDICQKLVICIDRDTDAYNAVSAAFGLAKESDEEKAARTAAIQAALQGATRVPYEVMELAAAGLALIPRARGKSNPNAASDLEVAALNLAAGVRGAWHNVEINLDSVKDEAFVAEFRAKAKGILDGIGGI